MRSIEGKKGFTVGGRSIDSLRYADDTVLIADSRRNCNKSEGE